MFTYRTYTVRGQCRGVRVHIEVGPFPQTISFTSSFPGSLKGNAEEIKKGTHAGTA